MNSDENKALVQGWLAAGVSSPEGRAMRTEDFRWMAPSSMDVLFKDGVPMIEGPDAVQDLPNLDKALYKAYEVGHGDTNVHCMIAEGDVVVMEFDAGFTTWEGEAYHNQYCLVFFVKDGKIAEVHEHADTRYAFETCLGTEEKRAGVFDRLARLRAGETV